MFNKIITSINEYVKNNSNFSRYSGFAFITEQNRLQYIEQLKSKYKDDNSRFELVLQRTEIGRELRIWFYRLFFLSCSIAFATIHFQSSGSIILPIVCGLRYYVVIELTFLNSLVSDQRKLSLSIFEIFSRKKKIQESQKPVVKIINGEKFEFHMQDILNIEYFRYRANEGENIISFKNVNKVVIGEKISEMWGVNKSSSCDKLLQKPRKGDLKFLNYKTGEFDKKGDANHQQLQEISRYLELNGLSQSKKLFDKHYFGT